MSFLKGNLAVLVAAAAVLQWLVFAGISSFSRRPWSKKLTMRAQEKMLIGSSVVLLVAWMSAFDGWRFLIGRSSPGAAEASAVKTKQTGSCASLDTGMNAAEVEARMGRPDQTRPDEEIRGPGAVTWLYEGSRCAVHLIDGKVEFVD